MICRPRSRPYVIMLMICRYAYVINIMICRNVRNSFVFQLSLLHYCCANVGLEILCLVASRFKKKKKNLYSIMNGQIESYKERKYPPLNNTQYMYNTDCRCKFYCANNKLVIVTDLYIHERSYCRKNGEIFIS